MKPIVVVRHAHPADSHIPIASHWGDAALSEFGLQQAECVGERLAWELSGESCRIWSSDLLRASQTADAIGRALGIPVHTTPELREYNNGLAEDVTEAELRKYVPPDSRPTADLLTCRDAETWPQFYWRVAGCMERLTTDGDERLLVVVGHFGSNGNIVNWWLKLGLTPEGDTPLAFETTLASITVLKVKPTGKRCLERLNDVAHLYAAGLLGRTRILPPPEPPPVPRPVRDREPEKAG